MARGGRCGQQVVQDGDGRREQNVTHDLLRQVMASKAYDNRVPEVVDAVRAGFSALYPGNVKRDTTGKAIPSEPQPGVTMGDLLDAMGVGSLSAAAAAGRRQRERQSGTGGLAGGGGDDASPKRPSVDDKPASADVPSDGQSEPSEGVLEQAVEHVRALWEQVVRMGEDITSDALEEVAHATRGLAVIVPGEPWSGLLELADKTDDLRKDMLAIDPDRPRAKSLDMVKDIAKDAAANLLEKAAERAGQRVKRTAKRVVTVVGPVAEVLATEGALYKRAIEEGHSHSDAAAIADGASSVTLTSQYVADTAATMIGPALGGPVNAERLIGPLEQVIARGMIEVYRATGGEKDQLLIDKVEEYAIAAPIPARR